VGENNKCDALLASFFLFGNAPETIKIMLEVPCPGTNDVFCYSATLSNGFFIKIYSTTLSPPQF